MPEQAVLSVTSLTAGYGGPPVIEDVGIEAFAGSITAIIGPNGAGKSTLIKAVAGVIRVSSGQVLLGGRDVANQPPEALVRAGISYVPQVDNVFPSLSVKENLEMGGYVRKTGVKERAEEMCVMFPDLKLAWNRPAGTLSGGQRNMLAMARGLMVDPKVILLDEPIAGLSPRFESSVLEHLEKVRELGVAVVVVEQNVRRLLQLSDRAYVMALGRNRFEGAGKDLLSDQEIVAVFIGGRA